MAIYFDLEFFVPQEDRQTDRKMKCNPNKPEHILLGGVFYQGELGSRPDATKLQELWLWQMKEFDRIDVTKAEQQLLQIINKIFDGQAKNGVVKTVGIGVSRFDLPALYHRSVQYNLASDEKLYERFFGGFPIDLSLAAIGLLDNPKYGLEPVPANELYQNFGIISEKEPGSSIWEYYDDELYGLIENRTRSEVLNLMTLFQMIEMELTT